MSAYIFELSDISATVGSSIVTINNSESAFGLVEGSQLFISSKRPATVTSFNTETRELLLDAPWSQSDVSNEKATIVPIGSVSSLITAIQTNQSLMNQLLAWYDNRGGSYINAASSSISQINPDGGGIVTFNDLLSATYAVKDELYTPLPGDVAFPNGRYGALVTRGKIIPEQLYSPVANSVDTAIDRQAITNEVIELVSDTYSLADWAAKSVSHKIKIASKNKAKLKGPGYTEDFILANGDVDINNLAFEDWRDVVAIPDDAPDIELISITNCKFKNVRYAGQRELVWQVVPNRIVKLVVQNNEIDNKDLFDNQQFSKGFVFFGPFTSVDCGHNEIRYLGGSAIEFANDAYATQDEMENIHVYHNTIEHIYDPRDIADGCNGIDVRGRKAIVVDNIITDMANHKEDDCEGIYTKVRFGRVAGNILTDAGTEEGFMAIKGTDREGNTAPNGYHIEVCNNTFVGARANTTGLFISASDVNAHHNSFEGFTHHCIKLDDVYERNVWVHHNTIIEPLCAIAITSAMYGESFTIEDNRCFGIGYQSNLKEFFFVKFGTYKGDIDDVQLNNNRLHLDKNTDYSFIASSVNTVWFVASDKNDIGQVEIRGNRLNLAKSNFPHLRSKVLKISGARSDAKMVTVGKNYTDADLLIASAYKLELEPRTVTGVNSDLMYDILLKRYLQPSDSGCVVHNANATGTSKAHLPNAIPGLTFTAANTNPSDLEFQLHPKSGESFRGAATDEYLYSSIVRSGLTVKCIDVGIWDVVSQSGTWQEALPPPAPAAITTANQTEILAADNGATINNDGVSVHRAANLPPAVVGLIFHFENTSTESGGPYELRVRPESGEQIYGAATGAYIFSAYVGDALTLECLSDGVWSIMSINGDWYEEGQTASPPDPQSSTIYTSDRTNLTIYDNGATVTNEGLQLDRAANLPSAIVGLEFYFQSVTYKGNGDPVEMRVRPATGDSVRGYTMTDYLYFETLDPYAEIFLECNEEGVWDVTIFDAVVGTV